MAIEYDPMTDHYVALGVGSTAGHDEIKKAHRALIRELHPDCGGDAMPAAQVNVAREVLVDPITREEYDRARRDWHEQNYLASALTAAGRQIHRERTQARAGASAGADTARRTQHSPAAHAGESTGGSAAAQAQPGHGGEPPGPDFTEWQPYLAKALFAGKFVHDALSGRSIAVTAIIGVATLLDRVIKHRVGDNPKLRDCVDQLSHAIWMEQVDEFKGIVETRTGRRWDP
jgi:curved DNA-binding protein CbpA